MSRTRSSLLAFAVLGAVALFPAGADAAKINLPLPLPTGCIDAVVLSINCAPESGQPICENAALQPNRRNLADIRKATLCLLNLERTSRGLTKLKNNTKLGRTAKSYSNRLVRQHFFSHVAPDGTTMLDRIRNSAYLATKPRRWFVGENIAYGTQYTAQPAQIVNAWMNSPGHRANLLNSRFREIGLGTTMGTPKTSYGATYVTDFGRRIR